MKNRDCLPLKGTVSDKVVYTADVEAQGSQLVGKCLVPVAADMLQPLDSLIPRQLHSLFQGLNVCLCEPLHTPLHHQMISLWYYNKPPGSAPALVSFAANFKA